MTTNIPEQLADPFHVKVQEALKDTEAAREKLTRSRDRWKNSAQKVTEFLAEEEEKVRQLQVDNEKLQSENEKLRHELEWLTSRLYNYANHVHRYDPNEVAKDIRAIASEAERSIL